MSEKLKSNTRYLTTSLILLLLAGSLLISACEETAGRITNRTLKNLEEEVGGAAEQSQQRASEKAGGAICGSAYALPLIMVGLPVVLTLWRANGSKENKRLSRRETKSSPHQVISNTIDYEETNDKF
jgi:hypothetical protein